MGSRVGIIVTGTEVLTGRVADRNGPWLAEQLRIIGVDIAQVEVVGDRPQDLHDSLGNCRGKHAGRSGSEALGLTRWRRTSLPAATP